MKRNKTWFSLGLVALSALALTLILMVLPAGAAHNDPDIVGTVTVNPEAVSPNDGSGLKADVGLKARTITVTVTDPNLNTIQFVGEGPNGEEAGDPRETITIPDTAAGIGPFLVALGDTDGNGIGNAIADRNHDGEVDASDLQIVILAAAAGNVTAGQVGVERILNAERGQVYFDTFARHLNGDKFAVRYATSSRELTRAKEPYDRTIHANSQDDFDDELDSTPQGDVTVLGAYASKVRVINSGATATFSVVAGMLANPGDTFVVQYEIEEMRPVGEVVDVDSATDDDNTFSLKLERTLKDGGDDGDAVTHADVSVSSPANVTATGYASSTNTVTFTLGAGAAALAATDMLTVRYAVEETVEVPGRPLQRGDTFKFNIDENHLPLRDGADGDTSIDVNDITIKIDGNTLAFAELTAAMDNPGEGDDDGVFTGNNLLTLTLDDDARDIIPANTEIKVTYLGYKDLVTVEGDGAPMTLRLRETASSSGIFKATVVVVNGDDPAEMDSKGIGNANLKPSAVTAAKDRPTLAVSDGSSVIVRYRDQSPVRTATERVDVEDDVPNFSNVMPADKAETNNLDTLLSAEVSDNIAGVNPSKTDSVEVIYYLGDSSEKNTVRSRDVTVAETATGSGVYVISYNINKIPVIDTAKRSGDTIEQEIKWRISVKDKAGNGANTDVTMGTDDPPDLVMRTLIVKTSRPTLDKAYSGDNWDTLLIDNPTTDVDERVVERVVGSRTGLEGSDVRTSIRLVFDRAMKGSSLEKSDFRVDGVAPTGVEHFSDEPASVFLTVPELAPGATPKIEIVGDVQDAGGNPIDLSKTQGSVIAAAVDGIAPRLSVTVVDDYTTGDIQLLVESDEPIRGSQPGVEIKKCVNDPLVCTEEADFEISPRVIRNRQEWSFSLTGFDKGLYAVRSDSQDVAGNKAEVGIDPTIKFEIDKMLPLVTGTNPDPDNNSGKKSEAEPFFIEIDWNSEGEEYDGDSHKAVTLTKAVLDAGTDNERDVLGSSSTSNSRNFTIAISDIGVGEHKLTYNGMDETGNALKTDPVLEFEVVVSPPLTLGLTTGMNLISVPRDPENTDIQAVFGDVEEITLVFTRPIAGESDLPWLVAVRDQMTGDFVGDLKSIDARHAYWVKASGSSKVEIDVPQLEAQRTPPSIFVAVGEWTLVPAISLAPIAPAGTAVDSPDYIQEGTKFDASAYFGSDLSKAFTFEAGQWKPISSSDKVKIGRGYWVLLTKDGNITPGTVR